MSASVMDSRYHRLQKTLSENFAPVHLELDNESHQHSVPAGSETHFKLLLVSEKFQGLSRVARQQAVYQVLKEEFSSGLHAFTQRLLTPEEWQTMTSRFESPECASKLKRS